MLPRKTGPAPIFNYRKRPRQAMVAVPESQTSKVLSQGPDPTTTSNPSGPPPPPLPPPQQQLGNNSYTNNSPSNHTQGGFARGRGRGFGGAPRPPTNSDAGSRPPGSTCGRPNTASCVGPRQSTGNWRGRGNTLQGQNTTAPNKPGLMPPIRHPAPAVTGFSGAATAGRQQQQQQYKPQQQYKAQQQYKPQQQSSAYQPSGRSTAVSCFNAQQQRAASLPVPKNMEGGGPTRDPVRSKPGADESLSLKVLTLPITHVRRAMGLMNDKANVPPFLFCVFGIVDSATVFNSKYSGKTFTLRDETGRITCVFCEIDRQMPRLHRGQWYRIAGTGKPSWQGLQCLSLRPVGQEERQAARAASSLSVQQLNDLYRTAAEL